MVRFQLLSLNQKALTSIEKGANPEWNQIIEPFEVFLADEEEVPKILVESINSDSIQMLHEQWIDVASLVKSEKGVSGISTRAFKFDGSSSKQINLRIRFIKKGVVDPGDSEAESEPMAPLDISDEGEKRKRETMKKDIEAARNEKPEPVYDGP